MHKPFSGSHTVLATPFTPNGRSVDPPTLRRVVDWQITSGSHGLIPLGSTGEFLSVTDSERRVIAETVVDAANGRVPVLIGAADEWTDKAIRYSREAQAIGADGLMIIPPYYASPSDDELFEHFKRIDDAVSIPIMVYNNPNTANVDLSPALIARLGTLPNVRYVKESSGDISRVREIHRVSENRVAVFAGYHPYESLAAGAKGYVSVIGNFLPAQSAAVCNLMDAGKRQEALTLYNRMTPLLNAIAGDRYVSATKCAMAAVGMPIGAPRPPRLALPRADAERLQRLIAEFLAESDESEGWLSLTEYEHSVHHPRPVDMRFPDSSGVSLGNYWYCFVLETIRWLHVNGHISAAHCPIRADGRSQRVILHTTAEWFSKSGRTSVKRMGPFHYENRRDPKTHIRDACAIVRRARLDPAGFRLRFD